MSEEKEINELDESLEAYKSKISQVNKATLTWDKDLIFVGRTNRGYEVEYDAAQQWGCSPTETLAGVSSEAVWVTIGTRRVGVTSAVRVRPRTVVFGALTR